MTDTHKKSFLLGAAVALAGVIVGIGAAQYTTAFSGASPNTVKYAENPRDRATFDQNDVRRRRGGFVQSAGYSREAHGAASSQPAVEESTGDVPGGLARCEGLTRTRYTHCVGEFLKDGTEYQFGQDR